MKALDVSFQQWGWPNKRLSAEMDCWCIWEKIASILQKWNDKQWENIKYMWCERQQNTSAWRWATFTTYSIIDSELTRDTNSFHFALKCLCQLIKLPKLILILIQIIQNTKPSLQKTRITWIISFYYKFIRIIGTLCKNDISKDGCKN